MTGFRPGMTIGKDMVQKFLLSKTATVSRMTVENYFALALAYSETATESACVLSRSHDPVRVHICSNMSCFQRIQTTGVEHMLDSWQPCNVHVVGGGFHVMTVSAHIWSSHSHPNMCPARYIAVHTQLCAGLCELERNARLIWHTRGKTERY